MDPSRPGEAWLERHATRILTALVAVAVLPPLVAGLRNLPYYHYGDEGHLLLWTRSIFRLKADPNIFYGPLLYYLYALTAVVVDPLVLLFGGSETFFSEQALTARSSGRAFYQDFGPSWMLVVARLWSTAFFGAAIVLTHNVARRLLGGAWGLAAAFLVASYPFYADFASFAQPEAAIAAGGALLLLYCVKHWERGFVYAGMGLLVVLRPAGGGRLERALLFGLSLGGVAYLMYLPYRTPAQMLDVIRWAHEYYATKPAGSLLAALVDGRAYLPFHAVAAGLGVIALVRRRMPLPVVLFAFLVVVNVAYFARLPFANTRNVVLVGVIGALFAAYGLREICNLLAPARRAPLTATLVLGAATLSVWNGVRAIRTLPEGGDSRRSVVRWLAGGAAPRGSRVHVALDTAIHRSELEELPAWDYFNQRAPAAGFVAALEVGDLIVVRGDDIGVHPSLAAVLEGAGLVLQRSGGRVETLYRHTLDPELRVYRR